MESPSRARCVRMHAPLATRSFGSAPCGRSAQDDIKGHSPTWDDAGRCAARGSMGMCLDQSSVGRHVDQDGMEGTLPRRHAKGTLPKVAWKGCLDRGDLGTFGAIFPFSPRAPDSSFILVGCFTRNSFSFLFTLRRPCGSRPRLQISESGSSKAKSTPRGWVRRRRANADRKRNDAITKPANTRGGAVPRPSHALGTCVMREKEQLPHD